MGDGNDTSGDEPQTPKQPANEQAPDLVPLLSQLDDDGALNLPFGRYVLIRTLGEGGMGVVYEAQQQDPTRRVALKVMRTTRASTAAKSRFLRETQILAKLSHPHVAQLFDAGVHKQGIIEAPFCVMELVRGASSITSFSSARKLPLREIVQLFLQVCGAVRHAHAHDVLHCDLKPSNILVNEDTHVKVIDFGVARLASENEQGEALLSDVSLLMGTPQYMSPEQVLGKTRTLDVRSDVYALGIVLYELLCGQLPYQVSRASAIEAAASITESEPATPSQLVRSLRGDAERVLLKALAKDKSRRYQTVAELEADLNRLLNGEPVHAPGRQRLYNTRRRSERFVARHHLFASLIAIVLAVSFCSWFGTYIADLGVNNAFERVMTTRVGHIPSAPLKHVVIVAMHDGADYATIGGATPEERSGDAFQPRFMRRVHGRFLKRLAAAGVRPRAVTLDLWFPGESRQWDQEFVDGVRSLGGVPVVVAMWSPDTPDPNGLRLSQTIAPHVSHGGIDSTAVKDQCWTIDLANESMTGQLFPSLALTTAAQYWRPGAPPVLEWLFDGLRLNYADGSTRIVDASSIEEQPESRPDLGFRRGSHFADYLLEIPQQKDLDDSTVDYAEAFGMSDAELRRRFDNRVVLVGDFRAGKDGPFTHPDGRVMPGVVAHAVAIDRIIDDRALRRPRYYTAFGLTVSGTVLFALAAAIGSALVATSLKQRMFRRVLAHASLMIACALIAVLVYRIGGHIYLPIVPALCVLLAGEAVAAVKRARATTI